jgi:hypothetical protein
MPLQNRVDPHGVIFESPARGTFMGNRGGALHNEHREIVRQYASRRWITCLLQFKGRKRSVMSAGSYTELFFLDEAVALSAGHRPCAECRRDRFKAFKEAWGEALLLANSRSPADEIDAVLHATRLDTRRQKITYQLPLGDLPDGSFVQVEEFSYLVWEDVLLLWSPTGYIMKRPRVNHLLATVLTPEPTVRCLRDGYKPEIHSSAFRL